MKKLLSITLLFCMCFLSLCPAFASESCCNASLHIDVATFEQPAGYATPMSNCKHLYLVRITPNAVRYINNGATHIRQEYFTARCYDCEKYEKEIVDKQEISPHVMSLIISDCDAINKTHRYVYKCVGYCGYEESTTLLCPGTHEEELTPTYVFILPEDE